MNDETVLYRANPSMVRAHPVRFAWLCALCFIVVGIPLLLNWWLRCKYTTLTITTNRVILRTGILSKILNEVRHDHVRNVQLRQNFFQRIFDVGWLGVSSAGQSGIEIEVNGIPHPGKAKSLIDARASTQS